MEGGDSMCELRGEMNKRESSEALLSDYQHACEWAARIDWFTTHRHTPALLSALLIIWLLVIIPPPNWTLVKCSLRTSPLLVEQLSCFRLCFLVSEGLPANTSQFTSFNQTINTIYSRSHRCPVRLHYIHCLTCVMCTFALMKSASAFFLFPFL